MQETRLQRVQNVNFTQGVYERLMQIGNVEFTTAVELNFWESPSPIVEQVDQATHGKVGDSGLEPDQPA